MFDESNSSALAPAGWGWPPGFNLIQKGPAELPVLPPGARITHRVMEAIQMAGPDLRRTLTSRKLMDRYGITRSVAHDALHRTATL